MAVGDLALLYLPGIVAAIEVVQLPADFPPAVTSRQLAPSLVTILEALSEEELRAYPPWPEHSSPYRPTFWGRREVTRTLEMLTSGITRPVMWVAGRYQRNELDEISRSSLLPPEFIERMIANRVYASDAIVRTSRIEQVRLPELQGSGNFSGASVTVFDAASEPISFYDQWLREAVDSKSPKLLNTLPCRADQVLEGAAAWLSQYGVEDQNHALIYRRDCAPSRLALMLAEWLHLPLIEEAFTLEELRRWEWDYTMPSSLRHKLSEAGC